MTRAFPTIIVTLLGATAVLAHSGVQNPVVLARMQTMEKIAEATKALGGMAKGQTPFDAGAARAALAQIEQHAAIIPQQFRTDADDPKSEASDTIWTNWDDFVKTSEELVTIAATAEVGDLDQLRASLGKIGANCKSCHADFRE
ncbi:c-type cytochrome [Silicimonas sp. MF1-12-2]|uniref:c-type cytochrome n=1 Tax=Silicimonas sp. MF1-12-2 TaxID=3384793 RepID=UPI0039B45652